MKCSNCNHQLREGTTECPYCGAQIDETNQNTRQENPYQTQYSQMNNYNNEYHENNVNPYNQDSYQEYNQDIVNTGYDFSNGVKNPYMQQFNDGYDIDGQYGQPMNNYDQGQDINNTQEPNDGYEFSNPYKQPINRYNQEQYNMPQQNTGYGATPPFNDSFNSPYGHSVNEYDSTKNINDIQQSGNEYGFRPSSDEFYSQPMEEQYQEQNQYNIQQPYNTQESYSEYGNNDMYGQPTIENNQNSYNTLPQNNGNGFTPPFNGSYEQPTEGYYQDQDQSSYDVQQAYNENDQYDGYEYSNDNSENMYESNGSEYQYGDNQQQDYNQNYGQNYDLGYNQQQYDEGPYNGSNDNYNNYGYNSENQYYNNYEQNMDDQNYGYNEQNDNYYQNVPEASIPNQESKNNKHIRTFGAPGTGKRRQGYSDQYNNFNEGSQFQQDYNDKQIYDDTSHNDPKNKNNKLKKKAKKKDGASINKLSIGLCILSFLIPIAGIILHFVKKKENKSFANTYGICAIVGIVFSYIIFSSVAKGITNGIQEAARDNNSSISQLINELESENSKTTEDTNNNADDSNTNDQAKPVVSNQKININGTDIELPCKYSDFSQKTGYSFGEIMSKGSFIDGALITATKDDSSIMLQITGEQDSEGLVKVQTCDISGIVVSKDDGVNGIDIGKAKISFFNDVKIGSTENLKSLTQKIGEPSLDADSGTDGSKSHIYQWKSTNNLLEITTIDDVIDSISYTYIAN